MDKYQSFTHQYGVSKTLRFQLQPEGKTKEVLQKKTFFQADKQRAKVYHAVKYYLDELHRKFVNEALKDLKLDYQPHFEVFEKLQGWKGKKVKDLSKEEKDKKYNVQKTFWNSEYQYRQLVKKQFQEEDKKWRDRYKEVITLKKVEKSLLVNSQNSLSLAKYLIQAGEIQISEEYPVLDEEGNSIFDIFHNFYSYFDTYSQNRANFYKSDGKVGRIATRIVNENVPFIFANYQIYEGASDSLKQVLNSEGLATTFQTFSFGVRQEDIQEYNQIVAKANSLKNELEKKSKSFKYLYKQILSSEEKNAYRHIEIDESSLIDELGQFIDRATGKIQEGRQIYDAVMSGEFDYNGIYLSDKAVRTLSLEIFGKWNTLNDLLYDKKGKKRKVVVITELLEYLCSEETEKAFGEKALFEKRYSDIDPYQFDTSTEAFWHIWRNRITGALKGYTLVKRGKEESYAGIYQTQADLEKSIQEYKSQQKEYSDLSESEKEDFIQAIRKYLESVLDFYQLTQVFFVKTFNDKKEQYEWIGDLSEEDVDEDFWNMYELYLEDFEPYIMLSSVRNFVTSRIRRVGLTDKIILNFGNTSLLKGWDKNKEKDCSGVIFREGNVFYLGILDPKERNILEKNEKSLYQEDSSFQKMKYKFLPDPKRMLPKVGFSKKYKDNFGIDPEIEKIKKDRLFDLTKNEEASIASLHMLIDHYKQVINNTPDWAIFPFELKETQAYQTLDEFYQDIERGNYVLSFEGVSRSHVERLVDEEKMYLFQITNKDLKKIAQNPDSSDLYKQNLHTSYWLGLFSQENLERNIIKLNGEAKVFYRSAKLDKKNLKPIKTKGSHTIQRDGQPVHHEERFAKDSFFFHVPLKFNYGFDIAPKEFEVKLNTQLAQSEPYMIGIDRGEKHLAYYTIVNQKGELVEEPRSLNWFEINGKIVNYQVKLDSLERKRQDERKKWKTVSEIKLLKQGYISYVVNELIHKILEYNAVIVFEDLSGDFKRIRTRIEKQVYQNLELGLIRKLEYLVFKDKDLLEPGGVLNAIQLTKPGVKSYKDVKSQTGIMFYTQAGYTSQTCPCCGYRKSFSTRHKNAENTKKFFENVSITRTDQEYVFELAGSNGIGWKLSSDVWRYSWENQQMKHYKKGKLTEKLDKLFEEYSVENVGGELLIGEISQEDSRFWSRLMYVLKLISQIRNSHTEQDEKRILYYHDYIICPNVECRFDSKADKFQGYDFNGDANGAYNISRKGIIMMMKLRKGEGITVNLKDWDDFATKENIV